LKIAKEFGFTPSARASLSLEPPTVDETKSEPTVKQFFNAG
jgi:phage terminase small subunit